MTIRPPWTMHSQSAWLTRSTDERFELYLRVAFLAYGTHAPNGHAPFEPGELRRALKSTDIHTGELRPRDAEVIARAIRTAIDRNLLDPSSCATCLVVPADAIEGGWPGDPAARCDRHGLRKRPPAARRQAALVKASGR